MKKGIFVSIIGILALLFVLSVAPLASAQKLHNEWFQLKIKLKGFTYDPFFYFTNSAKYSFTAYMQLEFDSTLYDASIWTPDSVGGWYRNPYSIFNLTVHDPDTDAEIMRCTDMDISYGADRFHLSPWVLAKMKLDTSGTIVKSATLADLGCIVTSSVLSSPQIFVGECDIKGKRVDVSKVPF